MGLELTRTEWSLSSVGMCLRLSLYIISVNIGKKPIKVAFTILLLHGKSGS